MELGHLPQIIYKLAVLIVLCSCGGALANSAPSIQEGQIDLSSWDAEKQPNLRMSGKWRFFPGQLINPNTLEHNAPQAKLLAVPGSWNSIINEPSTTQQGHGYGTYWLTLTTAATTTAPYLWISSSCSNARTFAFPAGGSTQATSSSLGQVAANAAQSIPFAGGKIIPLPIAAPTTHLLIQVSNFDFQHGGLCGDIHLGTIESLMELTSNSIAEQAVLLAIVLIATLYSLSIYIQHPKDHATLWLTFACLGSTLFFLSVGGLLNHFLTGSERWLYELQYSLRMIGISWAVAAILMFYWRTFRDYLPPEFQTVSLSITLLLTLLLLAAPAPVISALIQPITLWWAIQAGAAFWLISQAIRHQRPHAKAMALGFLPIMVASVIDARHLQAFSDVPLLSLYALVFFIFVKSQIVGYKVATTFRLAERLSHHLKDEVAQQTAELNAQNKKFERAQKELELANKNLKKLSITDGLTRVYNRMHFEQEYRKEWRRCGRQSIPMSVLMIDVDHFKSLNDSAGHLAGDQCLQAIAQQLKDQFKRAGELIARYGGEEFVVMLPDTGQRKALAVAEGLRTAIEKLTFEYNGNHHRVTISIGISTTTPDLDKTPDHLLASADKALYEAKHNGRNRIEILPLFSSIPPTQQRQQQNENS